MIENRFKHHFDVVYNIIYYSFSHILFMRRIYSFNIPLILGTKRSSFRGTQDEFSKGSILTAFDVRTSRKTSGGMTGLTFKFLQPDCVY